MSDVVMKPLLDISITPKDLAGVLGMTVQGLHKILKDLNFDTKVENTRFHRITPDQVRSLIEKRNLPYPKMIIDMHNVKGGVGKTTSTHAFATRAVAYGFKVLMIDLDQQANLTGSFGIHGHPKQFPTMVDVIEGAFRGQPVNVQNAIIRLHDHLHLIPANLSMANLDTRLSLDNTVNIGSLFSSVLGSIRDNYDLVFFDSPPSLSKLAAAAHLYSDLILMPIEPDKFSLDGLELNFEHIERMRKAFGLKAKERIFINKYDTRPKIDYMIISELAKTEYGAYIFGTAIRLASGLKASIAEGRTVWNSNKRHQALDDFDALFREITAIDEKWSNKNKAQYQMDLIPTTPRESELNG